jgi:hypothetical protein
VRRNLMLGKDLKPVKTSFREAFRQMGRRWQSMVGIPVGMIFQSTCNFAVMAWVPTYFLRVHGWTAAQTGKALAVIMIAFACTGMYVGGYLSDRWQKRGVSDGPVRVALISAVGIFFFLTPATLISDARITLCLLAIGMFLESFPMGTSVAALQIIFPNQVRGQVAAVFLFVLNLGGQTMGPFFPGFFNDSVFHNENMIGVSLSLTIGAASILMFLVFLASVRPYRRHYQMMLDGESSQA